MALNLRNDILSARALAILRVIGHRSEISQRAIADQIGLSLGTTNDALKQMIDDGIIHTEIVITPAGKRGCVYHLTAKGIERKLEITINHLDRCRVDALNISKEIQLLESELANLKS